MRNTTLSIGFIAVTAAMLSAACGSGGGTVDPLLDHLAGDDAVNTPGTFVNREGEKVGNVLFIEAPNGGVLMRIDLEGLPQGWHGMHLHQVGDCSDGADGFKASGGHVNPDQKEHGFLNPKGYELANLPNLYAGSDGRVTVEIFRAGVSLYPSEATANLGNAYPLLDDDGFAVIVHEGQDDHRTQPIGGSGGRIACAALGG